MPDAATVALISTLVTPAVVFAVQGFKSAGVPAKYSPLIALALGIVCGIAMFVSGMITILFVAIIIGAGIGEAASGVYSQVQLFRAPEPVPPTPVPPAKPTA